ncbi:MAG TPA: amino acid permease [Vicinamibacterales bacterium]|nr:amino acid permease [Vicinamibacterales bacterium]
MSIGRTRDIGFATALALVMGNMIGSGVYLLPASLAPYGGISVIGWFVSAGGAILLGLAFANLARSAPMAGGPYAYTRIAFGDLAGFLVAWLYWLSVWCGNAAIAVAFVGYLDPFLPGLARAPAIAAGLAIAVVWLLIAVNTFGVREAGRVQIVTTLLKVLPLAAIAVAGLTLLDTSHFTMTQTTPADLGRGVFATVTLTLWAFTGMDAATIPAGHTENPEQTIPRATVIGILLTAGIYIASTVAVMGLVAPDRLATTTAPFAEAARMVFGDPASLIVAAGAAVSTFGALNGWTLVVGQLPQAAAQDGLFPAAFGRTSRRGIPVTAMVISGLLASALIAANYTRGLVGLFTFTILLATLGALVPYVFCSLAGFLVPASREGGHQRPNVRARSRVVSGLAFVYAMCAIAGSGLETIFWGFLLLLAGLPVYVWVVLHRQPG